MPEIGTSSSMSGDGKRSDGLRPQATAPVLDSTRLCENALFEVIRAVRFPAVVWGHLNEALC